MLIEEVYKKYEDYSLKDFWEWISHGSPTTLEIRILGGKKEVNYHYLRALSKANNIQFYGSSFFVSSHEELLLLVNEPEIVDNYHMYYGLNPRKKIFYYSKKWKKAYQRPGTRNEAVKSLRFIPFDIEAEDRKGDASPDQLRRAMKLGDEIIRVLGEKYGWYDYMMLCSGNGIHVLFRLDTPLLLPDLKAHIDHAQEQVRYLFTKEFDRIAKIGNKFLDKMEVECKKDGSWLYGAKFDRIGDLSRVLRLPFSKNNKPEYEIVRKSGILHINNGRNEGMANDLLKLRGALNIAGKFSQLSHDDRHVYTPDNFRTAPIVQLLLNPNLPSGERNHYLEFQLALLMRDNNIQREQVIELLDEIGRVQKKKINIDPRYLKEDEHFNPDIVNIWCMNNFISPVYSVLERKLAIRFFEERYPFFEYFEEEGEISDKRWPECIEKYKDRLMEVDSQLKMMWVVKDCIRMLNSTMGKEFTKFVVKEGILKRYLET